MLKHTAAALVLLSGALGHTSLTATEAVGRPVKVSAIAIGIGGEHAAKLALALEHLEIAGTNGVDIACLPEEFAGFKPEPLDGPTTRAVAELAKKHAMWVVCPIRELGDDGKQYNTAVLLDRKGDIAGHYRKVFAFWDEGIHCSNEGVKTFDTDFGRIAILTCFDANFDELWQQAERQGAEIIFWPSAYSGGIPLNGYAMIHNYNIVAVGDGNMIDIFGQPIQTESPATRQTVATIDLDVTIVHQDFSSGKVNALRHDAAGGVERVSGIGKAEGWHVLRAVKPGVSVRELCYKHGLETLGQYRRHSRSEILERATASESIQLPRKQQKPELPTLLHSGTGVGAAVAVSARRDTTPGTVRRFLPTDEVSLLELSLRTREPIATNPKAFTLKETPAAWDPTKTAVVICDMWDKHWCDEATERVVEMAPRMNELTKALRDRGVLIVHCPSETMKFYEGHPARQLAINAPAATVDLLPDPKEGPWPIEVVHGGCVQDPQPRERRVWNRQIDLIEINDSDVITDDGDQAFNAMRERGVENLLIMGVHTNMCIIHRPFAIKAMVRRDLNVALVRDMTDSMYSPLGKPHVDHFSGTDLVLEWLEAYWCPTVTSNQVLGGKPFQFAADKRLRNALGDVSYIIADGPYAPNWESFKQYRCPEWFRDAKFGIWVIGSPQCQPEQGDWYARNMYIPGEHRYLFHQKTYGHQSEFGFKDICNIWTNENQDEDHLIQLYKRAGAKYFVAMANHHCNFDLWNSRFQPWNSVNIGPKKDLIGVWAAAARKHDLRFGVSVHNARSWDWYSVAHNSDTDGPKKGVPYDGALTLADGEGKWWEGYDPAALYGPHGDGRTPEARRAWIDNWFARTKDLIDQHHPDLLYFDDVDLPQGQAGLHIGAHFYNANLQWHGGNQEAVLNSKRAPPGCRGAIVLDLERGTRNSLDAHVWQTDTCIGDWHYNLNLGWYKNPTEIVRMLVDIVSKNGNLLLSIPIRADGTLDDKEMKFLEGMAAWMKVNEECIFHTRPWRIYGEGPLRDNAGVVVQDRLDGELLADIRFTTKGDTLYAIGYDWPKDGTLRIRSLANHDQQGVISSVHLLGHDGPVTFERTDKALVVTMPEKMPCEHAFAVKIVGSGLTPAPSRIDTRIAADHEGRLLLGANRAVTSGYSPSYHRGKVSGDHVGTIGTWGDWSDTVSWDVNVPASGEYDVQITYACQTNVSGSDYTIEVGSASLPAKAEGTGGWSDFATATLGRMKLDKGTHTLTIRPSKTNWKSLTVREIVLTPIDK